MANELMKMTEGNASSEFSASPAFHTSALYAKNNAAHNALWRGVEWRALYSAGTRALEAGSLVDAESLLLRAFEQIPYFSASDPRSKLTLTGLAVCYNKMGNARMAEGYFKLASSICGAPCDNESISAQRYEMLEEVSKRAKAALRQTVSLSLPA
jgi:tetratricopeptide (TPR) repeat protein